MLTNIKTAKFSCLLLLALMCFAVPPSGLGDARTLKTGDEPVKQQETTAASETAVAVAPLFNARKPREIRRTSFSLQRTIRCALPVASFAPTFALSSFNPFYRLRGPPASKS